MGDLSGFGRGTTDDSDADWICGHLAQRMHGTSGQRAGAYDHDVSGFHYHFP